VFEKLRVDQSIPYYFVYSFTVYNLIILNNKHTTKNDIKTDSDNILTIELCFFFDRYGSAVKNTPNKIIKKGGKWFNKSHNG